MKRQVAIGFVLMAALVLVVMACSNNATADKPMSHEEMVARGRYLVTLGGCNDCHTPKIMTDHGPALDSSMYLAGHPAKMPTPEFPGEFIANSGWMAATDPTMTTWAGPWGISFSSNLTPHEVYGSGAWTETSFINALRNGKHLGQGRPLLPPMPWEGIGQMSDEDLKAVFAYLHSLKPIANQVPQPIPPAPPAGDGAGM